MSDEGRLVAGRYRISKRIGTGAMGAVWQAEDELLGRTVAIKQLFLQPGLDESEADEARQRTMREGRIAARLHHPHAITVFDVVTDEHGQPCLIMEYLESTSLAAVLQGGKTLPPVEVARIGAQIADALKSAHRVGIVHRDIKPGNILIADDGTVKITDFGISRAKDDVTVTKTGMIAGTPAYLAPEVAIGQNPGPESDVFSLGSTLYAATEGQPPFGLSENTLSLLHAVAAGQIHPPRQSGPLTSVLALLLHPDKLHRPTAEETEQLLAAVARGETPIGAPIESAAAPTAALGAAAIADPEATQVAHRSGTLTGLPPVGQGDATTALYAADDTDPNATAYAPAGAYPEPEQGGRWKRPAAVGALVLAALTAFGLWAFTGNGDQTPPAREPVVAPTSTTTTTVESSAPADEPVYTTQAPQPQPRPQPEPEPEPVETTTETVAPPPTTTEPPTTEPTTTEPPTTEPPTTEPPTTEPTTTPADSGGGTPPGS